MKKTKLFLPAFVALSFFLGGCSNYYLKKANRDYESYNYISAIDGFEKVLKSKANDQAQIRLADSYRRINKLDKAETVYAEIVKNKNIDPSAFIQYAKILISNGKRDDAKIWIDKYLALKPNDEIANAMKEANDNPSVLVSEEGLFSVNPISFEGFASAFAAVVRSNNELFFSAQKPAGIATKKDEWSGASYYDIFVSKKDGNAWGKAQAIEGNINGPYHEGPACFDQSGEKMFFTRSNYFKKKLKSSAKNENNLKIFSGKLINGKWEIGESLPFNSDDYSVGHPSLSSDGSTLYFTSDMPGGQGETDIYYCKWNGKSWDKPVNMGPEINSSGKESFPYINDQDSSFFFSSDGHVGLGGLDIYKSKWNGIIWSKPENCKSPINSSTDDFAYGMAADRKTGYFSSNRNGSDGIFEWKAIPPIEPHYITEGIVTDKKTGKPLAGVKVKFKNKDDDTEDFIMTDSTGRYTYELKPNKNYEIIASKDLYFVKKEKIFIPKSKKGDKISKDLSLDMIVIDKPIVIENIYYDVAKWDIRPEAGLELDKLVQFLRDNNKINIELSSHTDSRSSDAYNLSLSNKRAQSAVDYIISKGIDTARLKAKGYGEKKLLNKCRDGIECTEEEHQMNRRTEIKVIKITG